MSEEATEPLKPLKTWSHLAGNRRKPSEYEIVSTNLHYSTNNPDTPWEIDSNIHMQDWYRKYRNNSPLKHEDWDKFRDPEQLVYRTYNLLQDGQESHVNSLLDQFSDRGVDQLLDQDWLAALAKLYTPARYAFHTLQIGSAYFAQIAPASTITNCGTFQAADSLRWLSHTAYRTRELANLESGHGFGENERHIWENDPAWQGFRELLENMLVAWDWAECFVALNLVAKPALEEALLVQFGQSARSHDDVLCGLIGQAQMQDAKRHRVWAAALVKMALETEGNDKVLKKFIDKYLPMADKAIDAFCNAFPNDEGNAEEVKASVRRFHQSISL